MTMDSEWFHFLLTAWRPNAVLLFGFAAVIAGYGAAVHWRWSGSTALFAGAMALLLLAVMSPLETLAGDYLLSAHMLQHLLLAQVVAPLLLMSLPARVAERALCHPRIAGVVRVLRRPAVAWTAGIGTLWIWHIPWLYQMGISDQAIRTLQHLSVLIAGLIFYWPIFAPVTTSGGTPLSGGTPTASTALGMHATSARMGALSAVFYLASACFATAVLGMVLTFSSGILYSAYANPADPYGILAILRSTCGLTPQVDQQISGLLMWVPCCFLYLGAITVVLARWYGAAEPSHEVDWR
jgi:putative membrane protein